MHRSALDFIAHAKNSQAKIMNRVLSFFPPPPNKSTSIVSNTQDGIEGVKSKPVN